ncbi:trans-resveratrol di-O-methyltransferase-like [Rhodamnia argentea]|uniref:Trans-resveratrol di-O-methyltransferase-like n=1 Tax=Rhodamnia argentea TaxID=178133 RepID=A0ABM3GRR7_9MYRT|nr:trans-resveratrol di-O-methyltransferase-like [Rhodamnia argentea]
MDLADRDGNATSSELLQAHAHIWNHVFSYITSLCLKSALQLGIPDLIHNHGQPMTLLELVSALHIHPTKANCIHRLMRILVHSGFFELGDLEDAAGGQSGYTLTLASRVLLKDNPSSAAPFVLCTLHPFYMAPWQHLNEWLGGGEGVTPTMFEMAHGGPMYEVLRCNPEANGLFNQGLDNDSRLIAKVVVETCEGVFDGLSSVVDVGGGSGTMGKAIVDAFPHLECTVLDLPHVVDGSVGSERLKFVGGDMFVEIPPADAILLKWILHNWSDEKCIEILKRSKEAVSGRGKGGKVIIIDIVVGNHPNDHKSTETQLFWDMLMMVHLNAKEKSEREWEKLFVDAGFSGYKIISHLGLRSLIEVYP